jgi:hypothetical protein
MVLLVKVLVQGFVVEEAVAPIEYCMSNGGQSYNNQAFYQGERG